MTTPQPITRFEEAALSLAERGYHIFPCRSRGKEPLTRNGFKDATRDERKILHWWDKVPDANIGVACGATGIAVLDIDAKHGADPDDVLAERDTNGAPVVLTGEAPERDQQFPRSLAGTRGAQVFFRGDLKTTNHLTIPGAEIRGAGAYVVVPPSVHPSGVEYAGELPPVAKLPPTPAWLEQLVTVRNMNGTSVTIDAKIPKGEQHHTLVSLAGSLRRRGMDADEIDALLQAVNIKRLEDPAPPENIRRIAESIAKYPPGEAVNGARSAELNPDAESAAAALGEIFALPTVDMKVTAVRVFGQGSTAQVEIDVSNGTTLNFTSRREMMRPQIVIAEIASCTGARPKLKQDMCVEAIALLGQVGELVATDSENSIASEWGRDYLQTMEALDIDVEDQAQRWRAFEMLDERDPWGKDRDEARSLASRSLLLRHLDGTLYVRKFPFEIYVRMREPGISRAALSARMSRVGWSQRGQYGDIRATAVGRHTSRKFSFWIVPADWLNCGETDAA